MKSLTRLFSLSGGIVVLRTNGDGRVRVSVVGNVVSPVAGNVALLASKTGKINPNVDNEANVADILELKTTSERGWKT